MNGIGERAWLFITNTNLSVYDDRVGQYYSYDDNVQNHRRIRVGDLVIIREDEYLAGWSIVDSLDPIPNQVKEMRRCPKCSKTNPSFRKKKIPAYKCNTCKLEFEESELVRTFDTVTQIRANYSLNWHEGARPILHTALNDVFLSASTFPAIRPLDLLKLSPVLDRLTGRDVDINVDIPQQAIVQILGGHTEAIVRRRRGQRAFRFHMMEIFGERCAFTGTQPPQVLEAAHLYSYAKTPEHRSDAGLLLRRDCHTLFDANLITINPESLRISIAPVLEKYETYRPLNNRSLLIQDDATPSRTLLKEHFEQSMLVFSKN